MSAECRYVNNVGAGFVKHELEKRGLPEPSLPREEPRPRREQVDNPVFAGPTGDYTVGTEDELQSDSTLGWHWMLTSEVEQIVLENPEYSSIVSAWIRTSLRDVGGFSTVGASGRNLLEYTPITTHTSGTNKSVPARSAV